MIEVGDHVTVGKGSTTWVVERANRFMVYLRSGVTSVHRLECVENVTLFKKGNV